MHKKFPLRDCSPPSWWNVICKCRWWIFPISYATPISGAVLDVRGGHFQISRYILPSPNGKHRQPWPYYYNFISLPMNICIHIIGTMVRYMIFSLQGFRLPSSPPPSVLSVKKLQRVRQTLSPSFCHYHWHLWRSRTLPRSYWQPFSARRRAVQAWLVSRKVRWEHFSLDSSALPPPKSPTAWAYKKKCRPRIGVWDGHYGWYSCVRYS